MYLETLYLPLPISVAGALVEIRIMECSVLDDILTRLLRDRPLLRVHLELDFVDDQSPGQDTDGRGLHGLHPNANGVAQGLRASFPSAVDEAARTSRPVIIDVYVYKRGTDIGALRRLEVR